MPQVPSQAEHDALADRVSGAEARIAALEAAPVPDPVPNPDPVPDPVPDPKPDPQPGSIVFASDFEEGLDDGGKWRWGGNHPQNTALVDSPLPSCPTDRALLIRSTGAAWGGRFAASSPIPVVPVGESMGFRWYAAVIYPDGLPTQTLHGIQDTGQGTGTNWMSQDYMGSRYPDGRWFHRLSWAGSDKYELPDLLDKNQFYRFELLATRVTATTAEIRARVAVRDDDGTETDLYDEHEMIGVQNKRVLADVGPLSCVAAGLASFRCGVNSWDDGSYTFDGMFQTGFAVRHGGWVGAA